MIIGNGQLEPLKGHIMDTGVNCKN